MSDTLQAGPFCQFGRDCMMHIHVLHTPVAESGCTHGGLNTNLSPFSNSKRVTANAKQDLRNRGAYSIRPANLPCTFYSSSLGGASEAPGRSSSGGNPASAVSQRLPAAPVSYHSQPSNFKQASRFSTHSFLGIFSSVFRTLVPLCPLLMSVWTTNVHDIIKQSVTSS